MKPCNDKIAVISAASISLKVFMLPHLIMLSKRFSVTAICSENSDEIKKFMPNEVAFQQVKIERKIRIFSDILALWKLTLVFYRDKYECVISITPKAGLLSMLAAFFCRIPIRTHIFTGQVWANRTGLVRFGLKKIDCLIATLATHVLTDSRSQTDFLITEGVVRADKISTLANGSICGVDVQRFSRNELVRTAIRHELMMEENTVAALFIGRMNIEKGIYDLAHAFVKIAANQPCLHLILVGPDEGDVRSQLENIICDFADRVHFVGLTNRPEDYMSAADFLCLPSYREGFGMVVIEAAAAGLPALVSKIYGLTDAVDDQKTGLFHDRGDIEGIMDGLEWMIANPELRQNLGDSAKERVAVSFSRECVVRWLADFYGKLLTH